MELELRRCPGCDEANRPEARFCDHCGTPIALSCPACSAELRPQARFCDGCGTPVATLAAEASAPAAYTPRHLADKILTSRSAMEGERKQVTVLFADVKGGAGQRVFRAGECRTHPRTTYESLARVGHREMVVPGPIALR